MSTPSPSLPQSSTHLSYDLILQHYKGVSFFFFFLTFPFVVPPFSKKLFFFFFFFFSSFLFFCGFVNSSPSLNGEFYSSQSGKGNKNITWGSGKIIRKARPPKKRRRKNKKEGLGLFYFLLLFFFLGVFFYWFCF